MDVGGKKGEISLIEEVELKTNIEDEHKEAVLALDELISNLGIRVERPRTSYLLNLKDKKDYKSKVEFIGIVQSSYILNRHIDDNSWNLFAIKVKHLLELKKKNQFYEHYYEIQTGLLFGERFELVSWEPFVKEDDRKLGKPGRSPDFAIRTSSGDVVIEATSFSPAQFTAIADALEILELAIRKQIEKKQLFRYVKLELPADNNLKLDIRTANKIACEIADKECGGLIQHVGTAIPIEVSWKLPDRQSINNLGYDYPQKDSVGMFASEVRMLHTIDLIEDIFRLLKEVIENKRKQVKDCNLPIMLSIRSGVNFFDLNGFISSHIDRLFNNSKLDWVSGITVITHREKFSTYTKLHRVGYFWNENAKFVIDEETRNRMTLNYYRMMEE